MNEDLIETYESKRRLKYHRVWQWADKAINNHELFPDTPDVDTVLEVGYLLPSVCLSVCVSVCQLADKAINNYELFPDTPDVDTVLEVVCLSVQSGVACDHYPSCIGPHHTGTLPPPNPPVPAQGPLPFCTGPPPEVLAPY